MSRNFTFLQLVSTRRQYARAFCRSLAAVACAAAIAGLVCLPRQIARLRAHPDASVVAYQMYRKGRAGILLFREDTSSAVGSRQYLAVHDVHRNQLRRLHFDVPIVPTCSVVTEFPQRLFVADALAGGIHAGGLRDIGHLGGCLGRHVQGFPHALACSKDGRTLISLGSREIYAWDVEQWKLRWCRTDEKPVCVVALPDSQSIICYTKKTEPGELKEIDLTTGEVLQCVRPALVCITQLTASPDGRFVLGTGQEHGVVLLERGACDTAWRPRPFLAFRSCAAGVVPAFSPQSDLLVLGHADGRRLVVWDVECAVPVCEVGACSESPLLGSVFRDQDTLLSWSRDGVITIWDLTNGLASRRKTATERRESRS